MCISPQTWQDYYNQQWRYQFAHEDLANEFPELAGYIPEIRKWTNEKYSEKWIDREWRETCISKEIDFDSFYPFYKEVLEKVRAGREKHPIFLMKTVSGNSRSQLRANN